VRTRVVRVDGVVPVRATGTQTTRWKSTMLSALS
jgi:hypothetical protein